jgi:hypothetical protein
MVLELLPVHSVVDFGCGEGTWLRVFQDHGVETILGIDGNYVSRERLLIDHAHFRPENLSLPVRLDQSYDLAISLEVAEHLPTRASRSFVESLVRAAPVVLFSAAIPGQRGTQHINEQWPEFWHDLFRLFDYECLDLIRPKILLQYGVEWWYKQNTFLYVGNAFRNESRTFLVSPERTDLSPLEPVARHVFDRYKTVSGLIRELLRAVNRSAKNRIALLSQRV